MQIIVFKGFFMHPVYNKSSIIIVLFVETPRKFTKNL